MTEPAAPVAPAHVCVQFAHGVLTVVAEREGVRLLHVKGAAIDPATTAVPRFGSDADVLVDPRRVEALLAGLAVEGWARETGFEAGSPFGHAATLVHPVWGHADVHRHFPGVTADPAAAFDELWSRRSSREIAGLTCPVPDPLDHAVLLVLNAARPGANAWGDLHSVWEPADEARRTALRARAADLGAEVAFAAAVGELDRFRDRPDHDLWLVTSQGGGRLAEWRARVRAAPSRREALRLALRAPLVNREHLAAVLGRPVTGADVARAYGQRLRATALELVAAGRAGLDRVRGRK